MCIIGRICFFIVTGCSLVAAWRLLKKIGVAEMNLLTRSNAGHLSQVRIGILVTNILQIPAGYL